MEWRIIFHYIKGRTGSAEAAYQMLIQAALRHRYALTGLDIVPVGPREITEAIFSLNSHDLVRLPIGPNHREISGQELKELLITTIYFKGIEDGYIDGVQVFYVLPPQTGSCDTAVMVAPADAPRPLDHDRVRLTHDHISHLFQVKEYFNYSRTQDMGPIAPTHLDIERLEEIASDYEEETLILLRDLFEFNTDQVQGFFDTHPRCRLIGMPSQDIVFVPSNSATGEPTTLTLPEGLHNYMTLFPGRGFRLTSLRPPATLVRDEDVRGLIL